MDIFTGESNNFMKVALITGSAGLIGSQACQFFHEKKYKIIGIDNFMRSYFFGEEACTKDSNSLLKKELTSFEHYNIDIRNIDKLKDVFKKYGSNIDIIIHTAAQPSHDWAANEPHTDFTVNANGTLNLLELTRNYCSDATFIFTSTNKVYGDRPNYSFYNNEPDYTYKNISIKETETRWEAFFEDKLAAIDESMSIDNCKHSLFGASKVSADILCQEYGKYFNLKTGIFRGGCLTGPNHAGTELHGFLSYLVKCIIHKKPYTIYGYGGKQVRDNIHSYDLVNMFWHFHKNPKHGEVYNAGGGRNNSISIKEAINFITNEINSNWSSYSISDHAREGDHIWYITDLTKYRQDYPDWNIQYTLQDTILQIIKNESSSNNTYKE